MRMTKTTSYARLDYRLLASGPNGGWTNGPLYDNAESALKIADAVTRLEKQRGHMEYDYRVVAVTETTEIEECELDAMKEANT